MVDHPALVLLTLQLLDQAGHVGLVPVPLALYVLIQGKNSVMILGDPIPGQNIKLKSSVSDPYSLNPDPAKNLNPDPSYFFPLSEFFF